MIWLHALGVGLCVGTGIAVGFDTGHPRRVLDVLAARGLVESYVERRPGTPPLEVTRWVVPVPIHIRWARWCATQPEEES